MNNNGDDSDDSDDGNDDDGEDTRIDVGDPDEPFLDEQIFEDLPFAPTFPKFRKVIINHSEEVAPSSILPEDFLGTRILSSTSVVPSSYVSTSIKREIPARLMPPPPTHIFVESLREDMVRYSVTMVEELKSISKKQDVNQLQVATVMTCSQENREFMEIVG